MPATLNKFSACVIEGFKRDMLERHVIVVPSARQPRARTPAATITARVDSGMQLKSVESLRKPRLALDSTVTWSHT